MDIKTAPDWTLDFVAFDTETTGTDEHARIVEIAVVRFKDFEVVDTWSRLINPVGIDWESPGVKEAMAVNQIDRGELEEQPPFAECFAEICEHLGASAAWCAHNTAFDLRMLRQERLRLPNGQELGAMVPRPALIVDTMLLDFVLKVGYYKRRLEMAAERWGVENPVGSHRASADAITSGKILCKMAPELWHVDETRAKLAKASEEWEKICAKARAKGPKQ